MNNLIIKTPLKLSESDILEVLEVCPFCKHKRTFFMGKKAIETHIKERHKTKYKKKKVKHVTQKNHRNWRSESVKKHR